MRHIISLVLLALLCAALAGCGDQTETAQTASASGVIVLEGTSITAGDGVTVEGTTATITAAGTYEISGTLEDGQIIVDTTGEVELVLQSADIHCETFSPVYVKAAKKVTVTLPEGSVSAVSDGASYTLTGGATEPDAVIYSKSDMVIDGSGTLTVTASYQDGITSKDTLRIDGGVIQVTAANNGIKGKDYLMVNGGQITVSAGNDGVKATNDTETALGYVEISGGVLDITAVDEGVSAITSVTVTGGTVTVSSENNGVKSDGAIEITGGTVDITAGDKGLVCQERTIGQDASVTVNGTAVTA